MTVSEVLAKLVKNPGRELLARWNWKSALFSSIIRASLFFFSNLKSGLHQAEGAMVAEFAYRALTAGFYGSLTQAFRQAEPAWLAAIVAMLLLPLCSHSIELTVHFLRGTPNLKTSLIVSILFTIISTLFNLYAMRRGTLIVGKDARPVSADLKSIPSLLCGFLWAGPRALYCACKRIRFEGKVEISGAAARPVSAPDGVLAE